MTTALDHRDLYRLPWSLPDNAIAWLEATMKCNLACDGCYRANVNEHKSLEQVGKDLDVFARYRNTDGISIAGGDPLTHPQIVDIVRMVADRGWKPILNTNGLALTEDLLRELKRAGLFGLTFHIDSKQHRPRWKNKTEQEHNELRLSYAEMVARVGGLTCSFNATIYQDTLDSVPDLVAWAQEHIDIVHVMVFICYRKLAETSRFDYYVGGEKVDMGLLTYANTGQRIDISARDVVATIRERNPEFAPAAYLNGTEKPDSFKWLLAVRLGTRTASTDTWAAGWWSWPRSGTTCGPAGIWRTLRPSCRATANPSCCCGRSIGECAAPSSARCSRRVCCSAASTCSRS